MGFPAGGLVESYGGGRGRVECSGKGLVKARIANGSESEGSSGTWSLDGGERPGRCSKSRKHGLGLRSLPSVK